MERKSLSTLEKFLNDYEIFFKPKIIIFYGKLPLRIGCFNDHIFISSGGLRRENDTKIWSYDISLSFIYSSQFLAEIQPFVSI